MHGNNAISPVFPSHRALLPARRQQYSDDDWRSSTASIGGGGCTETNALLHCVDDSKKSARRDAGACDKTASAGELTPLRLVAFVERSQPQNEATSEHQNFTKRL
ncbi:hypothetical protein MRX96_009462 [Rhipicephalus microplus]